MLVSSIKRILSRLPGIGLILPLYRKVFPVKPFVGSSSYWEERYLKGGNSGAGSYGRLAEYKAEIINEFVLSNNIVSVIEFGCGDGNQLSLSSYPSYIGVDVSEKAVELCRKMFKVDDSKSFMLASGYAGEKADLSISLDVIYHLVEDSVFAPYMQELFAAANRFVIIYSSNFDGDDVAQASHVRHRKFTDWVEVNRPDFGLLKVIDNRYPFRGDGSCESFADFYIYGLCN